MLYTIVDIETTGNGLKGNKVTEISIFKFDGTQVIEEFTSLVNPQCPIPYFITGLTGIDDETVRNAPVFSEIAPQVLEITQDCTFVAHAVNFDYGVIKEEFRQLGVDFARKKLCTVRLSRKLIPGLQSYSLGKLCSAVGIPIIDRHRARGDAEATVTLFKRLLQKSEADTVIQKFLNSRSQEATLPPHLDKSVVNKIPFQPGVYYFYDQKGTIIYIGKAKNLKKRVLGHFYDKSEHEIQLCREVAHIEYELSGSELIALLMESAAIKKHFPKFNRAQKRTSKQYAIFSYEDRRGTLHLATNDAKFVTKPLKIFNSLSTARSALEVICNEYNLCPKYCSLLPKANDCSGYYRSSCEGICRNDESTDDYNAKVKKALRQLEQKNGLKVIEQKGRYDNEKGVVLIKDGKYQGFGFLDKEEQINSFSDFEPFITLTPSTADTERILRPYL